MSIAPTAKLQTRTGQRGVSVLFALITLVVLSLGAVALVRSVDTGTLLLGNLGFKQDALAASSVGTEAAIAWLETPPGSLDSAQAAFGYSAVAIPALDPTGREVATGKESLTLVDWDSNGCKYAGLAGREPTCVQAGPEIQGKGGNKVRYVITRLCAMEGPPDAANDCVMPVVNSSGGGTTTQRGGISYSHAYRQTGRSISTYYRILTRTEGVRGTVSYTETLVHF